MVDRRPGGGAGRRRAAGLRDRRARPSRRPRRGRPGAARRRGGPRRADAVLVSGHREFDYEELLTATLALQGGATLFATSRDPTLPMPGGAWPGTGAALAAIETASGAAAEIGGKPERHLFELARRADPGGRAGGDGRRPHRLRHRGRPPRRPGDRPRPQRRLHARRGGGRRPAPRPRRRRPRRRCSDERASERPPSPPSAPALAFAGVFAVTFCGLLAVGAVLPVLPRYVHGPLDGGNIAVGIVVGSYAATGLLLRPVAGRYADRNGRRPTVLLGSLLVAARGFLYLLPLGVAGADRRPPRARRRRGHGLHRRLGLDRRPRPARAARPGDRPLRPRGLGRAQRRPADRRAAPARLRLHRWSGSSPGRCRWSGRRSPCASPTPTAATPRSRTSTTR